MNGSMTVRDATRDLLRRLGMTTVFGNPGSTELPLLADWPDDFQYVLGLQEASVVAMADGFARATGRAAFCNLHSAAGLGHALGNVFTAFRNQAPLVITAGQQARALLPLQPFLGATDAAQFPKPYVKWSAEPARAADVPGAIAQAWHIAMQRPCGPTFVSIPVDDWQAACGPTMPHRVSRDAAPDPAPLAALARALGAAERPVLVIGPEVDAEGAGAGAVALAERLQAPVWASPFAARAVFPEQHRLFAGFLPAAPAPVSQTLSRHDFVLVLGAPVFTFHVGGDCPLFRTEVPIWQLTADPEAAAAAPAGEAIVASLRLTLPPLLALLPPAPPGRVVPARPRPPAPAAADPIQVATLMAAIDRARPEGAIVVEEAPSHRPAMQDYLPMRDFGSFYTMASGGLGYALPAAVGVALASPGRRVICLIGDGSMMYSPQALWTAVQHRLPVSVVVVNNGGYGAMRAFSEVFQMGKPPGIDLPGLDFVTLAAGMGCAGVRVTGWAGLEAALARSFAAPGPDLVEVVVDQAAAKLYDRA
jgi:benzoylformate decarboxylase